MPRALRQPEPEQSTSLLALADSTDLDTLRRLVDESPTSAVAMGSGVTVTHANSTFLRLVGAERADLDNSAVRLDEVVVSWPTVRQEFLGTEAGSTVVFLRTELVSHMATMTWRWLDDTRTRWAATLDGRPERSPGAPSHGDRIDGLTGLPNRHQFISVLERDLRDASPGSVAVVFMDLDRFKLINDGFGHAVGDNVLRTIGHRLQRFTSDVDVVARIGGDEFGASISHIEHLERVRLLCRDLLEEISMSVTLDYEEFSLSGSIGIAVNELGDDAASLIAHADEAMYVAKQSGRNQIAVWSRAGPSSTVDIELSLHALNRATGLESWFQPMVDAEGYVVAVEALARWRQDGHLLEADSFVPVAERGGAMPMLTRRMLDQALVFARESALQSAPVHVNISQTMLSDSRLFGLVEHALRRSGLGPERLCLEITETSLVSDPEIAARHLRQLRAMGFHVAIDDFGTGFGSLTLARDSGADCLKIDRSFTHAVLTDPTARAVVRSIVVLAEGLGATVVAEGVEDPETAERLFELGCDAVQGFHFGGAMLPAVIVDRAGVGDLRFRGST